MPSDEGTTHKVKELTAGLGADVVPDFVGSDSSMKTAMECARPMGDVPIVGIAGGTLPWSFFSQGHEVNLATTYWGTRSELIELFPKGAVLPKCAVRALVS